MIPITFVSWNCIGLGKTLKRGKVFAHLKFFSSDAIFLQETNICPAEQRHFWSVTGVPVHILFWAEGGLLSYAQNCSIYILSYDCKPRWEVCYVNGSINSIPVALLNIYTPNIDCLDFYCMVFNLAADHNDCNIIIGGDFNCYFNSLLDRSLTKVAANLNSVRKLNNLLKSPDWFDIWRLQHPLKRKFSLLLPAHQCYLELIVF